MRYIFALVLAAFVAPAAAAQPDKTDPLQLALEVRRIFEAKCADCHGAHLPKPKGKFGHVLDLARLAANPEYIKPGDAEGSEIYQMVLHNEMPGEDADVPPLTAQELAVVAKWINIGAPGELPEDSSLAQENAARPASVAKPAVGGGRRFLNWLGKFHPASTHFPVALLLAAVIAESAAWWLKRPEWTLVVRFLVVLGALSAIPTAALGWLAMGYTGNLAGVYNVHKWLGTLTAIWAFVCAVLICAAECAEGSPERRRFRGALLFGALLVSVTGFLGGALVAGGLDHYKF